MLDFIRNNTSFTVTTAMAKLPGETQISPADYLCKRFEQDYSPHGLSSYISYSHNTEMYIYYFRRITTESLVRYHRNGIRPAMRPPGQKIKFVSRYLSSLLDHVAPIHYRILTRYETRLKYTNAFNTF